MYEYCEKKKLSKNFIKISPYKPSENLIHNSLGVDFDTAAILVLKQCFVYRICTLQYRNTVYKTTVLSIWVMNHITLQIVFLH